MSEQEQGVFVEHIPCPSCNSNDNLAVYYKEVSDTYDATCFGCSAYFNHKDLESEDMLAGKSKPKAVVKERITSEQRNVLFKNTNLDSKKKDGSFYRGLKPWVLEFYGHRVLRDNLGRISRVYYPETREGKLYGYKARTLPKSFGNNIGWTGSSNELSGQHKFSSGGKYIVIVGGEEDKCAAQQMFREYQERGGNSGYNNYAVVSPTVGEGGAAKQCKNQYEFLDSFENIVVCMDNDEAGAEAADKLCEVLPKEKVRVMSLSMKDPNQMLLKGKERQFISDFWEAKPLLRTGIFSPSDAAEGVVDFLTSSKVKFPPMLEKLNTASRGGIRSTGAIVNIIGHTSIGKTVFSDELQYYWMMNSPLKPTTLSIERTKEEFLIDMYSKHLGYNLTYEKDVSSVLEYLKKDEVQSKINNLMFDELGEPRFYVIDERDGDIEILKRQIEKAWKSMGSRLFILDPLSDILRSFSLDVQDDFLMWQKQKKKDGLVFINILHTRKPPVDKEGKTRDVTEYDALGSGSFVQSADINIVLNRDKMSDDSLVRNTTKVDVPKLRGGDTGHICDLIYDNKTRQQYDSDEFFKNSPMQKSVGFNVETQEKENEESMF